MLRRLVLLLIPITVHADALQDAVQSLATKIAAHLRPSESPRITVQNLSPLSEAEVTKVQSEMQRALHNGTRRRSTVAVALTISENVGGHLLVAQIRGRDGTATEMVSFALDPPTAAVPLVTIAKRVLWQQEAPILDLMIAADQMLVLEPQRIVRYERQENKWTEMQSTPLAAAPTRDPRGRIEVDQTRLNILLPTATCRGTWQPSLSVTCEPVVSDFTLGTVPVHFTPGRNTIEGDPKLHVEDVGDAVPACGGKMLASGSASMTAEDSITLFDGAAPVSEPIRVPGPVTALWPTAEGALAVVFDLAKKQHVAYALSLDCSQ